MEYTKVNRWLSSFDLNSKDKDRSDTTRLFIENRLKHLESSNINIIHNTKSNIINNCKINRDFGGN